MVDFVERERAEGRPVYVHCFAGVSRSGMVVTASLMQRHGWKRDETLAYIRTRRPIIRPNPAFMERLLEWELTLDGTAVAETP
jgi:protein-tyrosine phosphatase